MAGRNIYNKGPRSVENDLVKEALLPGSIVKRDVTPATAGQFMAVTAEADSNLEIFVLDKDRGSGQGMQTAYEANAIGLAFRCQTSTGAQVRVKDGSYTYGDKLTTAAGGRLAEAEAGNEIVGYVESAGTTTVTTQNVTDGDNLIDVIFTNRPTA